HHIAQPEPEGRGAISAMQRALAEGHLSTADVRHINAHATSTPVGDVAEAIAIRTAFGDDAGSIAVTSTKSMVGHLLGGAGAVESIATILALYHRTAPPTINVDNLDDEIGLDLVRDQPRPLGDGPLAAMNNSFGFGGHNVALAFRSI
ncbi:MAG: beta-ketoacyl-ACP synthase, partial [Actinobacteria bacterium]|nr:beta-ketoacyl-ACP synthase [Actinomycetota bacterium]NIS37240.1 beta-ketoacyl-ACP synthase [Actinomycetota bacterium]NIU71671.1 beta-ketoacyl-ACP synthase [Actinomycetota bacterium]NIW33623.1 beta-ketoacyl-ACP synthase [Actinomycetota bacterium]NIX25728.1 beta-ketoacyl-ACP synthase [Actinomycetota bacterium]